MMRIDLVTLIVAEYDPAIAFFTGVLGFGLVEDSPSLTGDGRPKRWVVVRPPGAGTGLLLARADGERQTAGRVGFFLHTDHLQPAGRRGRHLRPATPHRAVRPGRRLPRHRRQPMGPARVASDRDR